MRGLGGRGDGKLKSNNWLGSVAKFQFSLVLPPFFENREQNREIFFRTEQNQNRTV